MNYSSIIFTFFLLISSSISGQRNTLPTTMVEQVDLLIQEEIPIQEIMGISIGIVQNGKIVYTQGYGHTDLKRSLAVNSKTVFNWASISKTLTAVAAFQLIEDEVFTLNTTAKSVVGDIWTNSDDDNQITIAHLLNHRSGIRHYNNDRGEDPEANYDAYTDDGLMDLWNARQSVAVFNDLPLKAPINKEYRYSTFGYNLLGAMIDQSTENQSYERFITKRILAPLDTKSIRVSSTPWTSFSKDCQGAVRTWEEPRKTPVLPGGGWKSNIWDLTIFMNALINGSLLQRTSALWDDVIVNGVSVENKGYRFGLRKEIDSLTREPIVMHGGKHENVRTLMAFFPESKLGFTIMINGGYGDARRIFDRLATLFGKEQLKYMGPIMTREFINGCDADITGVWTKGREESIMRHGYTLKRFKVEKEYLEENGYYLNDCEYFKRENTLFCSGRFLKNNKTFYVEPTPYSTFEKSIRQMAEKRFRLIDVEVFHDKSQILYSGIFTRQLSDPILVKDLPLPDLEREIVNMRQNGKVVMDIESYQKEDKLVWAALFNFGQETEVVLVQSKPDFDASRSAMTRANKGLLDLELVNIDGKTLFSGIFWRPIETSGFRSFRSHSAISRWFTINAMEGERLIDLEKPFEMP
ncbi:MAG: serine hydrolase [Saprospiraceae bacterium]|nr:serine hydrolase [Saprospiraceae bacterium]